MKFKDFINKLKEQLNNKNTGNLIIIFLFAVLIFVFSSEYFTTTKKTASSNMKTEESEIPFNNIDNKYEESLKEELKETLSKVKGVGKVEVMIYFESGEEKIPVFNSNDSLSTSEETDTEGGERRTTQKNVGNTIVVANENGDNVPFVIKTLKPKITGVFIVAEGASDVNVEYKITQAVMNLFDIQENNIKVYPMAKY